MRIEHEDSYVMSTGDYDAVARQEDMRDVGKERGRKEELRCRRFAVEERFNSGRAASLTTNPGSFPEVFAQV